MYGDKIIDALKSEMLKCTGISWEGESGTLVIKQSVYIQLTTVQLQTIMRS